MPELNLVIIIIFAFVGQMIPVVISAVIASYKERNELLWAFLGLIFGWIAVLIVACLSTLKPKTSYNSTDDLIQLKKMLDAGIITQKEFEKKKKELLHL